MDDERTFYLVQYRLDQRNAILIWYAADQDGVVCHPDGGICVFPTTDAAQRYAAQQGIALTVDDAPAYYDFDAVEHWTAHPLPEHIDYPALLNAWNLFTDSARSVGVPFDTDHHVTNPVYDKLFAGNNLPSIVPPGRVFIPRWNTNELRLLCRVLRDGLRMLRQHQRSLATSGDDDSRRLTDNP